MSKPTRQDIETALAAGNLFVVMTNGARWKARRNGVTALWKRDPDRFSIPVKAGLRACGRVDQDSVVTFGRGDGDFEIQKPGE